MKKRRTGGWAFLMVIFGIMSVFWALGMGMALIEMWDPVGFIFAAVTETPLVLLTVFCARKAPKHTKAEIAEIREKAQEDWERLKAERKRTKEYFAERKRLDNEPVSSVLICVQNDYGKNAIGTAARGLLGAVILGKFGAAVGIASGRAKEQVKYATFAVKYASGRKANETVAVNSPRFKELCEHLID